MWRGGEPIVLHLLLSLALAFQFIDIKYIFSSFTVTSLCFVYLIINFWFCVWDQKKSLSSLLFPLGLEELTGVVLQQCSVDLRRSWGRDSDSGSSGILTCMGHLHSLESDLSHASVYVCVCVCVCSVTKSYLILCDPMNCSTPGFPVLHYIPEFAKFMSIELVMLSKHLIIRCQSICQLIFFNVIYCFYFKINSLFYFECIIVYSFS